MLGLATILLIVLLFVLGMVGGLNWVGTRTLKRPKVDPEQLLRERFARGEISEEEYGRRLAILKYGPPPELLFPTD